MLITQKDIIRAWSFDSETEMVNVPIDTWIELYEEDLYGGMPFNSEKVQAFIPEDMPWMIPAQLQAQYPGLILMA